jgi:hypothetical protein
VCVQLIHALERGHTKKTGNFNATAIYENYYQPELNTCSVYRLVGGGVQLVPLGTAATDWPIVSAPGEYDDGEFGGMKIGRETE